MLRLKRNKLEIIKDLLGIILLNRNILLGKLIHKSNLSPPSLKEYTKELVEKGLIKERIIEGKKKLNGKPKTIDRRSYNLTELGREFLEDYRAIDLFLEKYSLNEY